MRKVRILVACGGGVATSSFAAMEIEAIAKENGVDVDIHKDRLTDAITDADNYDLLCVTSKFSADLKPRIVQVGGLISGINEDKVRKEIKEVLIELANK